MGADASKYDEKLQTFFFQESAFPGICLVYPDPVCTPYLTKSYTYECTRAAKMVATATIQSTMCMCYAKAVEL